MRKRSSLGPFPKRYPWPQVVRSEDPEDPLALIPLALVRQKLADMVDSEGCLPAMDELVKRVVRSRGEDSPDWIGPEQDGIAFLRQSRRRTLARIAESPRLTQGKLQSYSGASWREFDSASAFTELARIFFAIHLEELLLDLARAGHFTLRHDRLAAFTWDMTQIVVPFTARWFSTCVRDQNPTSTVVQWYLRHCGGKLDLELEREADPKASAYSKPKVLPDQLGLDFE